MSVLIFLSSINLTQKKKITTQEFKTFPTLKWVSVIVSHINRTFPFQNILENKYHQGVFVRGSPEGSTAVNEVLSQS